MVALATDGRPEALRDGTAKALGDLFQNYEET
jgi:hypothetical protein